MAESNDRLDSWKSIADYLGRDVRTVRRWEEQGLPVSRVSGLRGNSVFAFKSEIDAWLKARVHRPQNEAPQFHPAPAHVVSPASVVGRPRWVRLAVVVAVVLVVILSWKTLAPSSARQALTLDLTEEALVARNTNGTPQWRFEFPLDSRHVLAQDASRAELAGGTLPAVYAGAAFLLRRPDNFPMSGVLRSFSIDGRPQSTFRPDDRWIFGGKQFDPPWAITDFRVNDAFGRRRLAVAVHHYTWWPSFVTILDERLQRTATFVNSGWAEAVRWVSPDRLAISGFNEALDGGMLALLDVHNMDGASPEAPGSKFECTTCRSGRPLVYVVFPRSEVNRVTGAPFNRVLLDVSSRGITAHSSEEKPEPHVGLSEGVFEFSPTMELLSASYGSRYWDRHRALELEGKITHSREECAERDGPRVIKIWTRDAGWVDVTPPR